MHISQFDFDLPPESIAQHPITPRDHSKLLVVSNSLEDKIFLDLPSLLNEKDMLVFNNTKVIPARLIGMVGEAKVEVTLHKSISLDTWVAFAKPGRKMKPGKRFVVADDFQADILAKDEAEVTLKFHGENIFNLLEKYGIMPLPPYIKRSEENPDDHDQYQTIFAKEQGAVAAPTAGLHFTDRVFDALQQKDIQTAFLTLHVGAGTFLPVKTDDVTQHQMHSEYGVIDQETADRINQTKAAGGRVVAVGTTSLRLLESASDDNGMLCPFKDETDIFITPGYQFKITDALITNFHIPKSTLFMLVSAFSGLEKMKQAYAHAIAHDYRFFSYGDACFLTREAL